MEYLLSTSLVKPSAFIMRMLEQRWQETRGEIAELTLPNISDVVLRIIVQYFNWYNEYNNSAVGRQQVPSFQSYLGDAASSFDKHLIDVLLGAHYLGMNLDQLKDLKDDNG